MIEMRHAHEVGSNAVATLPQNIFFLIRKQMSVSILVREVENCQRHMVLYQTDFYDFERQSKALTNEEKYDYCSKD